MVASNTFRSPSCMVISWSYVHLTFVNKKRCHTPFFKKDTSFIICIFFLSFKKMQFLFIHIPPAICPVIRPVICPVICLGIRPVIWCFPIWLTSSLSYPMAIFSANRIRTFLYRSESLICWLISIWFNLNTK